MELMPRSAVLNAVQSCSGGRGDSSNELLHITTKLHGVHECEHAKVVFLFHFIFTTSQAISVQTESVSR